MPSYTTSYNAGCCRSTGTGFGTTFLQPSYLNTTPTRRSFQTGLPHVSALELMGYDSRAKATGLVRKQASQPFFYRHQGSTGLNFGPLPGQSPVDVSGKALERVPTTGHGVELYRVKRFP